MAPGLDLQFSRRFPGGADLALDEAGLGSGDAPVTVLFGPSGGGKTTLIRCVAGLVAPDRGRIAWRGETWFDSARGVDLSPQRRRLGLLTQEYDLFPHLSVQANVEFGLHDLPRREARARTAETLGWLGLADLAGRRPGELSGGQRQRVAFARAIVRRPRLLLLDEPFSALDAPTRRRLRGDLRPLLRQLGIPALVVTHDRAEAMALADELVVLCDGRVAQRGPAMDVFNAPASLAVARLVGIETFLPARCESRAEGLAVFRAGESRIVAVDTGDVDPGGEAVLAIRGEDVILARAEAAAASPRNRFAARVTAMEAEGALVRLTLDAGFPLEALVTRQAAAEMRLAAGEPVWASVKAPQVLVIARR